MAFNAGAITGWIGLDINPFARGMMQATAISELFPATVRNFLANPLLGLAGIARDAANAIKDLFVGAMDEADRLGDLAASVGVSVETLSAWGFAARQSGASTEEMAEAFKHLGKTAAEAVMGNKEAAATFAKLGISMADVRRGSVDLEFLMFRVADELSQLADGGWKSTAAMDLLSGAGARMVPLLGAGSDEIRKQIEVAKRYNAVVTETAAAAGDKWNDLMGEVRAAWSGIKMAVARPLADALTPMLNRLLQWVREHPKEIAEKAAEVGQAVAAMVQSIVANLKDLVSILREIIVLWAAFKGAMAGFQFGSVFGPVGAIVGGLAGGVGGAMAAQSILNKIDQDIKINISMPASSAGDDAQKRAEALAREIDKRFGKRMAEQRAALVGGSL